MSEPSCYVASELGFTESGRHYYQNVLLPSLRGVVTPFDPWNFVTPDEYQRAIQAGTARELSLSIGARNAEQLAKTQLLVAVLEGQEIDAGVAAEIGAASAAGARCLGLRTDLRESGETGMRVNLQVEAFIVNSGGAIVNSLDALVEELKASADEL